MDCVAADAKRVLDGRRSVEAVVILETKEIFTTLFSDQNKTITKEK